MSGILSIARSTGACYSRRGLAVTLSYQRPSNGAALLYRQSVTASRLLSSQQQRSYGDHVGGNQTTTINGSFNRIWKDVTFTKVTGGSILIVLIAGLAGYLYCESNPDKEICDTLRSKLGIKKN